MSKRLQTKTGGREATQGVIPGRFALSVGKPNLPAPDGWEWVRLTDVARLETGHTPSRKKPEYWDGEIPWVGIKDATSNYGRVISDTHQHVTQLGIDNSSARLLPTNTVCLSRTASVGYVVIMGKPMATSQDFVNWVCSEKLDYRYLAAILIAENSSFSLFSHGTTHQTIYFPEAKAFHILLPPIHVQNKIADVIWNVSEKIELNRRTNQTLEQIAQTLFKSWFVDFDPVRAKVAVREHFEQRAAEHGEPLPAPIALAEAQNIAAAATIASLTFDPADIDGTRALLEEKLAGMESQQRAQLLEAASIFPDAFVETKVGLIPAGWNLRALPEMVDFKEGPGIRNWQYTNDDTGCKFINIRCIKEGDLSLETASRITEEEAFGKYSHFQLEEDDIVISTSGTLGRFAFVRKEHLPLCLNTSVIRLRPINGESTLHYLAGFVATQLQLELEIRASGSVQRNFGPTHLKQIEMLAPPIELLERHQNLIEPLFRKRQQGLQESDALSSLRDLLLPKLLSGEIQLNPESVVEAS